MKEIYKILIEECGADKNIERLFLLSIPYEEFRFQGKLGFGGKLNFRKNGSMYVSCYQEDLNPERQKMIEKANNRLSLIQKDL